MSAAPGWYDAGTPGRLRWWDGAQWTAHEADAPAAVAAPALPVSPAPAAGPLPGWYVTPAGPARWWDGKKWTGLRTKNGTPGTDWANAEQASVAWTLAAVFLSLGGTQLVLGSLSSGFSFVGIPTFLVAALWVAIAIQTTIVQRIPIPTTAPLTLDDFRPLPGEQEGPGAGWYPLSPTTSRWWTGTRWSQYTNAKVGIRPTFHGPRAMRTLRWTTLVILVLAAVAVIAGILLIVAGTRNPAEYMLPIIGWATLFGGVLFAALGAAVYAITKYQMRLVLLPSDPPRV